MKDRQMFQGNWVCTDCPATINELPFQPRSEEGLRCFDCMKKNRPERRERKMFQGDWSCMECSTDIKELPFDPRDPSTLSCRDCHMKSR